MYPVTNLGKKKNKSYHTPSHTSVTGWTTVCKLVEILVYPSSNRYGMSSNVVERLMGITDSDRQMDDNLATQDFIELVRNSLRNAREAVTKSIRLQKLYHDHRHGPIRPIQVGDFVSIRLDQHPVSLVKRTKLTQQKLAPCKVLEVLANGHAVRLDLPQHIGIHPVLSIQHVDRAVDPTLDPFKRSDHAEPPAVDEEGQRWEVEIIDEKPTSPVGRSILYTGSDGMTGTTSGSPPAEPTRP
jgi:hypothetical protein